MRKKSDFFVSRTKETNGLFLHWFIIDRTQVEGDGHVDYAYTRREARIVAGMLNQRDDYAAKARESYKRRRLTIMAQNIVNRNACAPAIPTPPLTVQRAWGPSDIRGTL